MSRPFRHIEQRLIAEWTRGWPQAVINDMAIPSYYHWNPLFRWLFRRRIEEVCRMVRAGPHARVLDFGCGIGLVALNLASECGEFFAYDVEPRIMAEAAAHFGLSNVTHLKGERWFEAVPPRSMDVVIAADVLEHVEDLAATLETLDRLLAPEGRLLVSGPTEHMIYRLGRLLAGFKGEYHCRNIHDIRAQLERTGYALGQERRLPWPILIDAFHLLVFRRTAR